MEDNNPIYFTSLTWTIFRCNGVLLFFFSGYLLVGYRLKTVWKIFFSFHSLHCYNGWKLRFLTKTVSTILKHPQIKLLGPNYSFVLSERAHLIFNRNNWTNAVLQPAKISICLLPGPSLYKTFHLEDRMLLLSLEELESKIWHYKHLLPIGSAMFFFSHQRLSLKINNNMSYEINSLYLIMTAGFYNMWQ